MKVELCTNRLVLRTAEPVLAPAVLAYFEENRAHLAPTSPPLPADFYTLTGTERRLARAEEELAHERQVPFFVVQGKEVIGTLNFNQCCRGVFLAAYVGYGIGHRHEGQGLMREALEAGIRHMFDERGFHRIMANYLPTNERSGGLLRRLGFVVEGYARDYLFIAGAWRDHVMTALTNPNAPPPLV